MSLTEILEEVAKLSPAEKMEVLASLSAEGDRSDVAVEEKREQLLQKLHREGLIARIPAKRTPPRRSRPVPISGKPLSETIIEERR